MVAVTSRPHWHTSVDPAYVFDPDKLFPVFITTLLIAAAWSDAPQDAAMCSLLVSLGLYLAVFALNRWVSSRAMDVPSELNDPHGLDTPRFHVAGSRSELRRFLAKSAKPHPITGALVFGSYFRRPHDRSLEATILALMVAGLFLKDQVPSLGNLTVVAAGWLAACFAVCVHVASEWTRCIVSAGRLTIETRSGFSVIRTVTLSLQDVDIECDFADRAVALRRDGAVEWIDLDGMNRPHGFAVALFRAVGAPGVAEACCTES